MKKLKSINPYTGDLIVEFEQTTRLQVHEKLANLDEAFSKWRTTSLSKRSDVLNKLANLLDKRKHDLALVITEEMGKPLSQSIAEIEKCAWVCRYYAETGPTALKNKSIATDGTQSFISYEPIGVILAVMPWNYPFWQFFRVLAPNLILGNTILLKHASSVSGCALAIANLAEALQLDDLLFDTILVESSRIKGLIEEDKIKGVTLTGSEKAGASVASIAGKNIKKTVLELGGSNAVIILKDADIDKHIDEIVNARFQNTGQSCIAGKRYLVQDIILDKFRDLLLEKVAAFNIEDPVNEETKIGPMANEGLAEELEKQLQQSIDAGAKLLHGGKRKKAHFEATVVELDNIDVPVFSEETFGPLAVIKSFKTVEDVIELSNNSNFGLGASIFTEYIDLALKMQSQLQEGAVFINSLVKSDPRLPFGGIGKSGYGRELSEIGLTEFANIKTVYVR